MVSFLEVNTRLQVEHPVTEEVSGIDLVREMFRIAEGEAIGYDDPPWRGHSIEFRMNAEDPGRNFLPTPGTIAAMRPPSGPGVRLDSGYTTGMTVPQVFDSLIAKLIVTGRDRREALERSRRALAEFEIDGLPTALPFHRAVVADPAFTDEPFRVHTRWIETEFAGNLPPFSGELAEAPEAAERQQITVEVGGKRLDVVLPAGLGAGAATPQPGSGRGGRSGRAGKRGRGQVSAASGDDLVSPMQGTIAKIVAEEGSRSAPGTPWSCSRP